MDALRPFGEAGPWGAHLAASDFCCRDRSTSWMRPINQRRHTLPSPALRCDAQRGIDLPERRVHADERISYQLWSDA
jgi:hypothetical protein